MTMYFPDPELAELARHRMSQQQDHLSRGIELRDQLAGGPPEHDGWRSMRFWRVMFGRVCRPTLEGGVLALLGHPARVCIRNGSLLPAELVLASLTLEDPPAELLAYAALVLASGAVEVCGEGSP